MSNVRPHKMPFLLEQIPLTELRDLANAIVPSTLVRGFSPGALPPAFVADRSVKQIDEGKSEFWCSTFYVVRNKDNKVVGSCGFKHPPRDGMVEIGYGISPSSRNEGAATAAVRQLLDIAFTAGAEAVLAEVSPENMASTSIVRRLNFRNIGRRVDADDGPLIRWLAKSGA